jgi:acyl-CoA thioesterase-1
MTATSIWKLLMAFSSLAAVIALTGAPRPGLAAATGDEIVIVAFGDSLTAGYQLPPAAAFPAQLEKALRAKGHNVRVVNAGVSGDTSADGLARLDWAMPDKVGAVILELGANDALRGIPVERTKAALGEILSRLKARGAAVLIAGMEAPRNWGPEYAAAFSAMYRALAEEHGAPLYPFFVDGVALQPSLNLGDGLHPNADGVAEIVRRILPSVEALIATAEAKRGKAS